MIYFRKVRWKNFLSTGNQFTEMDLASNKSMLFIGENGSGKSSVLDAITFAMYGKPFRKVNKPQLVNSITLKNMLVELELDINGKEFLIRRGMKPNVFEIIQEGKLINQESTLKDYQSIFETNILKLSYKSFCQIVILGKSNFVPFMQLPAQARRDIIEDLLDIQVFSVMNSILKNKIVENKNDLIHIDYEIKLLESKKEMNEKHIASLKQNNKDLIRDKSKKVKDLNKATTDLEKDVDKQNKAVEKLLEKVNSSETVFSKNNELTDLITKIKSKSIKIEKELEFFETTTNCPTCTQELNDAFKSKIVKNKKKTKQELIAALEKVSKQHEKILEKMTDVVTIQNQINETNKLISDLNMKIKTNNSIVESILTEISDLEKKTEQIKTDNAEFKELVKNLEETAVKKTDMLNTKELYGLASQLLKDGGIKTKIIKQYIPIMNKLINKYLAAMEFFVQFEINEEFEENIKSRGRDEFSYNSFSEGEKMRIDLALCFAWRAIAKLRNSAPTNLLILDEIFDSSLDTVGTDELMKILNTLAADSNVIVISHKDNLIDKFDKVVKFEKKKNFSRIAA